MSGFLFGGAGGGKDLFARDQLALTNLRLMLQTGIASGALMAGYQWELLTDEWGGSSAGETYVAGSPNYYSNPSGFSMVPQATGTPIGDMTSYGGPASAFDGTVNIYSAGAASAVRPAHVGKDWGAGVTRTLSKAVVKSPSNYGFCNSGTVYLTIQGSNDGSSYTDLGTTTTSNVGANVVEISNLTTGAYRYHRLEINNSSGDQLFVSEFELYEFVAAPSMVLISPAAIAVPSAPSFADAYFLWKDDSGAAVVGTDVSADLSRDGGTTWTAADLSTVANYDASYACLHARADVSSQPVGTSIKLRINVAGGKSQRVAAPAVFAE